MLTVQQIYRLARLFAADDHEPGGTRAFQHAYELVQLSRSETCVAERQEEAEELIAEYVDNHHYWMRRALCSIYRILDDVPGSVGDDLAQPGEAGNGTSIATYMRDGGTALDLYRGTEAGRWAMWAYDAPRGD